ncbi:transmembrane protein 234 homolog [Neocloeon triangulifer]|uniref:transmembrane protein 234 homolog n=1 Tax=Neocloeon triangulifer TaxID=2078957 RepID=UPI00286EE631|nr:transmembrane protein 234 homolog [Neocloeon triangulifer]
MLDITPWAGLFLVGLLWGGTNPFIKRGSTGVKKIKASNIIVQLLLELKYLFTEWRYVLPFALNQLGSVVFFLTLQKTDLSLAVPIANASTFLFTALVGQFLGEDKITKETLIGILLVLSGIMLCVYDKSELTGIDHE